MVKMVLIVVIINVLLLADLISKSSSSSDSDNSQNLALPFHSPGDPGSIKLANRIPYRNNCSIEHGELRWYEDESREKGNRCRKCPKCNPGFQPNQECGNGVGKGTECEECPPGTYSDEFGYAPCKPCAVSCSNTINDTDCTRFGDKRCGPCQPMYFKDFNGNCEFCGNYRPDVDPACTLTSTPVMQFETSKSPTASEQTPKKLIEGVTPLATYGVPTASDDALASITSSEDSSTVGISSAPNQTTEDDAVDNAGDILNDANTGNKGKHHTTRVLIASITVCIITIGVLVTSISLIVYKQCIRQRLRCAEGRSQEIHELRSLRGVANSDHDAENCVGVLDDALETRTRSQCAQDIPNARAMDEETVDDNVGENSDPLCSEQLQVINENQEQKRLAKIKRPKVPHRSVSRESQQEEENPLLPYQTDTGDGGVIHNETEGQSPDGERADVNIAVSSRGAALIQTATDYENGGFAFKQQQKENPKMRSGNGKCEDDEEMVRRRGKAKRMAKGKPIGDVLNDIHIRDTITGLLTVPPNSGTSEKPIKYYQELALSVGVSHTRMNVFKGPFDVLNYMNTSMVGDRDQLTLIEHLENIARYDIIDELCTWISQKYG